MNSINIASLNICKFFFNNCKKYLRQSPFYKKKNTKIYSHQLKLLFSIITIKLFIDQFFNAKYNVSL